MSTASIPSNLTGASANRARVCNLRAPNVARGPRGDPPLTHRQELRNLARLRKSSNGKAGVP